jgi:hypothetical protein
MPGIDPQWVHLKQNGKTTTSSSLAISLALAQGGYCQSTNRPFGPVIATSITVLSARVVLEPLPILLLKHL